MRLYDAHNHLQQLGAQQAAVVAACRQIGLAGAVVNGTQEKDWAEVEALSRRYPWVRPAFGLHPWYVRTRTPDWLARLAAQLEATPGSTVGEMGLDRWVEGYDWPGQLECFRAQLALAAEREVAATVHCLRAWGALLENLQASRRPTCGVLIHAYGGPAEMVTPLVKCGAYFSFNAYFLHARKQAQREVFAQIVPLARLLVETDAPAMLPPEAARRYRLSTEAGEEENHPANLEVAYELLAELRGMRVEDLAAEVEGNFGRLFGGT